MAGGTKTWAGCALLFGGLGVSASLPFGVARLVSGMAKHK